MNKKEMYYNTEEDISAYLMIIERYFLSNLHKNLCCGNSLESPQRGNSNEHPQHRFL